MSTKPREGKQKDALPGGVASEPPWLIPLFGMSQGLCVQRGESPAFPLRRVQLEHRDLSGAEVRHTSGFTGKTYAMPILLIAFSVRWILLVFRMQIQLLL